ncbi:unnamed protein product [Closterium sp. NIES-65]|nr:unnamed protein product [Closterium sp. NIES-65]
MGIAQPGTSQHQPPRHHQQHLALVQHLGGADVEVGMDDVDVAEGDEGVMDDDGDDDGGEHGGAGSGEHDHDGVMAAGDGGMGGAIRGGGPNMLSLSYHGEVYVFDCVPPEKFGATGCADGAGGCHGRAEADERSAVQSAGVVKRCTVQAVLLLLGGREVPPSMAGSVPQHHFKVPPAHSPPLPPPPPPPPALPPSSYPSSFSPLPPPALVLSFPPRSCRSFSLPTFLLVVPQASLLPFPSPHLPASMHVRHVGGGVGGDLPVRLNQPQRLASLNRFREKRKERNFDKKIRYSVRKEVAQR